jgi:hypothetical protein
VLWHQWIIVSQDGALKTNTRVEKQKFQLRISLWYLFSFTVDANQLSIDLINRRDTKSQSYIFFTGSAAPVGTGLCFSVSWSFLQTVGLLGWVISSSQGLYLNIGQHKHRINTYTLHPCPEWDSNPRSQRPSGHCDRPVIYYVDEKLVNSTDVTLQDGMNYSPLYFYRWTPHR